ncbi:MAG TPA: MBL fold metallo-hydrolase [Acidimicrobiales bacterium]|nr:MBL fold metallo-hydrolase [Acidimicrobiales bacterium]
MLLDLGTGVRALGDVLQRGAVLGGEPLEITALLTHLHWDHVIGLPFFVPAQRQGGTFTVYGPRQEGPTLPEMIDKMVKPPFFPVGVDQMPGTFDFVEVGDDDLAVGPAKVRVREIPHVGTTLGFRVEAGGASVAYLSDHQQPTDGVGVAVGALELCDGADLVIHDAQYTTAEFEAKSTWGHCTVDYALRVAAEAGAKTLALFHHDPTHDDDQVDTMLERALDLPDARRLDGIIAAAEGLTLELGPA